MDDSKFLKIVVAASLLVSSFALADGGPDAVPTSWMVKLGNLMQPPTSLSSDMQNTCTQRILDALNDQFGMHFDTSDLAPIFVPGWKNMEMGFVRGGGYNIRVYATGLSSAEVKRVHAGRFLSKDHVFFRDLKPSLHVPNVIWGVSTMTKSQDASGGKVDFIAHIDSQWAYSPFGLLDHLFTDVLGSATRNPCPSN